MWLRISSNVTLTLRHWSVRQPNTPTSRHVRPETQSSKRTSKRSAPSPRPSTSFASFDESPALDLLQTLSPSFDPPIRKVSLSFSADSVRNALTGYNRHPGLGRSLRARGECRSRSSRLRETIRARRSTAGVAVVYDCNGQRFRLLLYAADRVN